MITVDNIMHSNPNSYLMDGHRDFLENVIEKVHCNLSKGPSEWCPCKYHPLVHSPSDIIFCEQTLFHAPELIHHLNFVYLLGCMNTWIENNKDYITDPFFVTLSATLKNGDKKTPALTVTQNIIDSLKNYISK